MFQVEASVEGLGLGLVCKVYTVQLSTHSCVWGFGVLARGLRQWISAGNLRWSRAHLRCSRALKLPCSSHAPAMRLPCACLRPSLPWFSLG